MNLQEILADIHALEEELLSFERKYGVRSETFQPGRPDPRHAMSDPLRSIDDYELLIYTLTEQLVGCYGSTQV